MRKKYSGTKYDHTQSSSSIVFWENIFKQHYGELYESIEWYDGGDKRDVEDKIDCHIVLNNGFRDFQVKDQDSPFYPITINLNIKSFNRYADGDYNLNGFGIGIIWDSYAYLIKAESLSNIWEAQYEQWLQYRRGRGEDAFLAVPEIEFVKHFDYADIKRYDIVK